MPKTLKHLINFAVNGAANGVMASVGSNIFGVSLNFKQIGMVALSGAVIATFRHLQQSPLIPE